MMWCTRHSVRLEGRMDVTEEQTTDTGASRAAFESWFHRSEPPLRAALVATFGAELGREATAEALSYAWEHRSRVLQLDNPIGYAFRVGQRWAQRQQQRSRRRFGLPSDEGRAPGFEPALAAALDALPLRQRQVVVLCIGYGLTHAEAAGLLGIARSTIQNHAERGLRRLQKEVGT